MRVLAFAQRDTLRRAAKPAAKPKPGVVTRKPVVKKDTTRRVVVLRKDSLRRVPAAPKKRDTTRLKRDTARLKRDTTLRWRRDTTRRAVVAIRKPDSLAVKDSVVVDSIALARADSVRKDSLQKLAAAKVYKPKDTSTYAAIMVSPYFPFGQPPEYMIMQARDVPSKDYLFYLLAGVVFFAALTKLIFPKYFSNVFRLMFQTSFRQKQTRDQMTQDNLAALFLNILFVMSGSLFITLLIQRNGWLALDFWLLLLYAVAIIGGIYIVKYLFLVFSGWVFNARQAAASYIFTVFFINKIIGIVFLPLILLLAFANTTVANVCITIALIVLAITLVYRYVASLGSIRSALKVNALHFFLYLCAVEVLPLVLIYKAVLNFAGRNF